jgi:beta-glucanase (GH16 family)
MFGQVDVFLKASPGTGIVSSFILESDDLDEIDWEWLGSTDNSVESNFFGKGNTTTYDRAIYHNVASPIETWHNYSIVWTAESTKWYIDGALQRTLNFGDALALGGKNYPQTPMRVKMGNWVGCASKEANQPSSPTYGTCQWAGGPATFGSTTWTMLVANVTINDFGCGGSYTYSDMTGDWQSIKSSGTCDGSSSESGTGSATTSSAGSTTKTTSGAILAQTADGNSTTKTTMSTATGTGSSTKPTGSGSGSPTTSAGPVQATSNDGNGSKKSKYGVIDVAVIALGLGLGYLVM